MVKSKAKKKPAEHELEEETLESELEEMEEAIGGNPEEVPVEPEEEGKDEEDEDDVFANYGEQEFDDS